MSEETFDSWQQWAAAAPSSGRFERLFDDLEAELEAEHAVDLRYEVADRARSEYAELRLGDRLRPLWGKEITVRVIDVGAVSGQLREVGPDWILLCEGGRRETLIPSAAVALVDGLLTSTAPPTSEGKVAARLGLRSALRGLARDRVPLELRLAGDLVTTGTIDRVGADFFEVAEHALDQPRRARTVRGVRTVATPALRIARTA